MKISLKKSHGFLLTVKADNVNIEEDIEHREYTKVGDKIDLAIPPKRDLSDDAMGQISTLLSDMAYYRVREFDSSDLIEQLFEKLSEEKQQQLLTKLKKTYE